MSLLEHMQKAFNEIHRSGRDLDNNPGIDFFTATNRVNGRNMYLVL